MAIEDNSNELDRARKTIQRQAEEIETRKEQVREETEVHRKPQHRGRT